ncbi:MAG: glycosyltransferase family 2 protein [Synergistaceae bacterium]|nr:glycosyltransferase family 2 protein [Synergistaceae bacterium]MBR1603569.1 glycosyltransferase family 2 protein [Synergistaceae bacterium]
MTDLKKLSVIIPAYNAAKFLVKCVDGIANQTYENIEIVIVNNGSQDNTLELCEELKAKYNNREFKIINLNPNQGINWARRAGFENASGDYVTTIDSDDYIDLNAYARAIKVLEANDCDMVQFGHYEVYPDGRILEEHKCRPVKADNAHDAFKYFASVILNSATLLWDKVYKRSLFENLQWPKVSYTEDYCTDTQLFAKVQKFMSIDESFYYHTANPDSVCSRVLVNRQSIEDFITGSKFVTNFTAKAMPEFLPEILCYSVYINFSIIIGLITLYYPEDLCKIMSRDYKRMNSELKRQNRKLDMNPPLSSKLSRKQRVIMYLLANCPRLYYAYLKTRLTIKKLTGI